MLKLLRPRSWTDPLVLLAIAQFLLILHLTRHSLSSLLSHPTHSLSLSPPPIHIVLTASLSYTLSLVALLNSTLSNASPSSLPRLHFHIVSTTLEEAERITRSLEVPLGTRVRGRMSAYGLLEMGEKRLEGVKVWAGYRAESLSQPIVFARYVLQDLLPASVERVIYLDLDVLVQKDLAELWDIDMEGHPIAAARLCRSSALWRRQFMMQKAPLASKGFDDSTCTLNNGVLVYDLRAWRAAASPSYTNQLFEWTRLNGEDKLYNLGSQPPFNLVFYRNYKILDDRWNLMDIAGLREETEWGHGLPWTRSRDEVLDAAILHWNGVIKPWMCDGEGYYSELWEEYFPDFRNFLPAEEENPSACANLVVTLPPAASSVEQFTVVIASYNRVDNLLQIAAHLRRSIYVKEILVVWNNPDVPCPTELVALPWVRCLPQAANHVQNRFLIWPEVSTEAALHHNDDLLAPLDDLEAAFSIWRRHREQVLGFEPRVIVCDGDDGAATERLTGCQYRSQLTDGHFDLVTGKLFFIAQTLTQVPRTHPCDVLSTTLLAPPLLFKSNLTQLGSAFSRRAVGCVQELVEGLGGRPGRQESFYELDRVRRRVYKLSVREWWGKG